MSKIVVMNHVTLDGVMQSPGRPDDDTRGGFTQGGWATRSTSPGDACAKAMGERMTAGGGLAGWLFGRRTYEDVLGYWNGQPDSPFAPMLNNTPKYVVSTTLTEPLRWPNSTLLRGETAGTVRRAQGAVPRGPGDHGQRRADRLADRRRPGRRVPADDPSAGPRHRTAAVPREGERGAAADREHPNSHRCDDRHL